MESSIVKDEAIGAIRLVKSGKATEPDQISSEILKLLRENGVQTLTKLFYSMYDTGTIPTDWLTSTFVMVSQKIMQLNRTKPTNH